MQQRMGLCTPPNTWVVDYDITSQDTNLVLHWYQHGVPSVGSETRLDCSRIRYASLNLIRSRPNWITGPGPKSGSAGKSGSHGPENGVSSWRWPNSDIYSQNYHFGLAYDMIYQFLGTEAKNYKFGMFCQQCHPSVACLVLYDIRQASSWSITSKW